MSMGLVLSHLVLSTPSICKEGGLIVKEKLDNLDLFVLFCLFLFVSFCFFLFLFVSFCCCFYY